MPNLTDYMAGAMLATGLMWIWHAALSFFGFLKNAPPMILADAQFIIYLSSAIVSSFLVCKRASSRHLITGLKLSIISWVFSIFMILSLFPEPNLASVFVLLACFVAGDIAGAYLALRSRLRHVERKAPDT